MRLFFFLLLVTSHVLASPVQSYKCTDESGQWRVEAKISLAQDPRIKGIGSLSATLQSWSVVRSNLDVKKTVGDRTIFSTVDNALRFEVNDRIKSFRLVTTKGSISLSCFEELNDLPPVICNFRSCRDGGSTGRASYVNGYQCPQINIMCK